MTDTIQIVTGIASLAVSIMALPGSWMYRLAEARAIARTAVPDDRSRRPGAASPGNHPGYPSAPPPGGSAPPFPVPVPAPPSRQGPTPAVPEPNLRPWQVFPYGVIGGAVFGALGNVVLKGSAQWLIAGLVLLVIAIAVFVWAQRAPGGPTLAHLAAACGVAGISITFVANAFVEPGPTKDSLAALAVIVPVMVIWIVVDRMRHARSG